MPRLSYAEQGLPCRKGHDNWVRQTNGRWRCKDCNRQRGKKWADANRALVNARHRVRQYWVASNLARYGLTVEDKQRLWMEQHGCCAICFDPIELRPELRSFGPHVDHDHKTGRNRGLLCHRCNTAIGLMREERRIFDSAVAYLERWHAA